MTQTPAVNPRKTLNPWVKFALELGPLALFFIAYGRLG
ncbi:MAG: septation protein A, partial [Hyphomicrobiales bacterium]|nr:septation protein A [Hyphomicrobiales bacterium]